MTRDPVEDDAEYDRPPGPRHALFLGAPGRTAPDNAFDRLLGAEEHDRAGEQAECDAAELCSLEIEEVAARPKPIRMTGAHLAAVAAAVVSDSEEKPA